MKRVCIHQPDFVPYLGFYHRLLLVDLFIVLDDVQFLRKGSGWHNRDKIKTQQGARWLTLSVQKGMLHQKINEVFLSSDPRWIEHSLNLLTENYRNAPFFDNYFHKIKEIYCSGFSRMVDLNLAFLYFSFEIFEIQVETILASQMHIAGRSNERLINLIKAVDGTHYLTGTGSRDYLDEEMFLRERITVEWQVFVHPAYDQLYGPFIPDLSWLDLLFNCGPSAKDVLRSCLVES